MHKRIQRNDQLFEIVGIVDDLQHRRFLEPDSADPDITFGAVIALRALVAAVACLIPAAPATRIDPMVALRAE